MAISIRCGLIQRLVQIAPNLATLLVVMAAGALSVGNGATAQADDSGIKLVLNRKPSKENAARLEVAGVSARQLQALADRKLNDQQWAKLLRVVVFDAKSTADASRPAMLGSYQIQKNRIVFRPRFPFQPGLKFRAVFRDGGQSAELVFALPKPPPTPLATIVRVYPSRNTLPENLLKFYIHFSAPMSRGEAYSRVKLLNAKGKAVEFPFLELGEELWDRSGTRFTLFFDPGRIKRGLKPRELYGPALETGKSYTLVIDREWNDAKGRPLKAAFRKTFKVADPDDKQPDTKTWQLATPVAGSRQPLTLRFPEPLDHALLRRLLVVKNADGRKITGSVEIDKHETRWRFTPKSPWTAGSGYAVEIGTTLEDLAGNSIGRPFEIDVVRKIGRKIEAKTVKLPFQVKSGRRNSR